MFRSLREVLQFDDARGRLASLILAREFVAAAGVMQPCESNRPAARPGAAEYDERRLVLPYVEMTPDRGIRQLSSSSKDVRCVSGAIAVRYALGVVSEKS